MSMQDVEQIIDQAWTSLLLGVMRKRAVLRPEIGDEIDLYLPQSRLISLVASNAQLPKPLYAAARSAADRNARSIVKKLGMPPDYFWKFEYWPKARAMTGLGQIVKRVFSSMMSQAKEGNLDLVQLDLDPLRITIDFGSCAECGGISGLSHGICYFHAGTFAGILSGLLDRELDASETACCTMGHKSCRFLIGDRGDKEIQHANEVYLSRTDGAPDLASRLQDSLGERPARELGNLVDVNYHRLILASTLLADQPHPETTSLAVGSQLGRKLASVLEQFYGRRGVQSAIEYYSRLRGFKAEMRGDAARQELVITDCAESAGTVKTQEMLSFLEGELQGMISALTETDTVLTESRFEGEKLVLAFAPRAQ